MADVPRPVPLPALFPPAAGEPEEQHTVFRRAFDAFKQHLEVCQREESYAFAVGDLEVFRAFFNACSEERASLRGLIAAGRVTLPHYHLPESGDLIETELWRRNLLYGARCWEGLLGGALDPDAPAERPTPAPQAASELAKARADTARLLLETEKLATLALLAGVPFPDRELDRAWRQLLFAQRGLGAPGGPDDRWYVDAVAACQEAALLAAEAQARARYQFAEQVNTASTRGAAADGGSLLIINTSGRAYSGPVSARIVPTESLTGGFELRGPNGRAVPFAVAAQGNGWLELSFEVNELPAAGYRTYTLSRGARKPAPRAAEPLPEAPVLTVQSGVHTGPLPPELTLFTIDNDQVEVTVLKPLGSPLAEPRVEAASSLAEGLLLRLRGMTARRQSVSLTFGCEPTAAWLVDLQERKADALEVTRPIWGPPRVGVEVGPGEVVSLAVQLKLPAVERREAPVSAGGAEEEESAFCRYWDHHAGAAPAGNAPVGVWLGGTLELGKNTRFPVCLSNDSADHDYIGAVDLHAPQEWTLLPRRIPYRIAPRSQGLFEAMVIVPAEASPCFLRAELYDGNCTVQDVLPIGEVRPLEISVARRQGTLVVALRNPNPDYLEASVMLVTPPSAWPGGGGELGRRWVRVPGEGEERLLFTEENVLAAPWVVAKVAWYGHVQYARAEG